MISEYTASVLLLCLFVTLALLFYKLRAVHLKLYHVETQLSTLPESVTSRTFRQIEAILCIGISNLGSVFREPAGG